MSNTKLVAQLDDEGYFIGPVHADWDQLIPDRLLLPFGTVDALPGEIPEGKRARFVDGDFILEDIPPPSPPPPPPPPTPEELMIEYQGFLLQVKTLRETAINRLMGIAGRAERANQTQVALACDAAAESLLAITAGLPTDLEAAEDLVVQRWQLTAATLAQAAPSAVSAFMGLEL